MILWTGNIPTQAELHSLALTPPAGGTQERCKSQAAFLITSWPRCKLVFVLARPPINAVHRFTAMTFDGAASFGQSILHMLDTESNLLRPLEPVVNIVSDVVLERLKADGIFTAAVVEEMTKVLRDPDTDTSCSFMSLRQITDCTYFHSGLALS
jgi:hypothetical protein